MWTESSSPGDSLCPFQEVENLPGTNLYGGVCERRSMAQQTTADDRTAANLNTADWSSEDWAEFNAHPSENNHYVSTTGNITRHCTACGYEGTHDHPRRSRPTFHADLTHHCPDAKCGARLHSGPRDECEDCEDEDEDDEQEMATDGGTVAQDGGQPLDEGEDENPHQHRTVWQAAANLETHEDGSAPRVGVEYRKKNGQGTARKAGTVEQVEVQQPDGEWTHDVEQPVPRIVFQRDDGQRMYVEPDGLYTVGSHAPYVGSVVSLTTSTTSTVGVPEGVGSSQDSEREQADAGAGEASGHVPVPDILGRAQEDAAGNRHSVGQAYVSELAAWARTQDGLHGTSGSEHYSWDIPGFSKQNDPHNGFTAKSGGECVYVVIEGERSEAQERALAELASRDDLEVSAGSRRVTLVPGQDLR